MKIIDVKLWASGELIFSFADGSGGALRDAALPFRLDKNNKPYVTVNSKLACRTCSCLICRSWEKLGFRAVVDPKNKERLHLYLPPDINELVICQLVEQKLRQADEGAGT